MLRQFFSGPAAALNVDPRILTGPSGRRYNIDDVDDVDVFVAELWPRVLTARKRGHRRLAEDFQADIDSLLERRLFLAMCPTTED
jgi:hypothetical protein